MAKKQGLETTDIYGDPALLLPLVYKCKKEVKYKLGIIPHGLDIPYIKKLQYVKNSKIIFLHDDIEDIIDAINSCEYVITSSLHGLIVSHAYGIPALWVEYGYIGTDGIKFNDYLASVNLPLYDGTRFRNYDFMRISYNELPEDIKNLMLPKTDIRSIQRRLLKAAPFRIKIPIPIDIP